MTGLASVLVEEFLQQVITTKEGYFNLCMRSAAGVWHDDFYSWPDQQAEIIELATKASEEYDVYFSSYLYSERTHIRSLYFQVRLYNKT